MASKRKWAIPIEDGASGSSLLVDRSGRVLLSTMQHVEEREPRGLAHVTKIEWTPETSTTRMFVNSLARRCSAIDPRGELQWQAPEVVAVGEDPTGRIVATNDAHDMILLDTNGTELERRPVGDESWTIVGWNNDVPILSATTGQAWVAPHVYTLTDHELRRCDPSGKVLDKFPLARDRFDAICTEQGLTGWQDSARFPITFDLAFDAKHDRFIATNWGLLAWVMSIRRDGKMEWLTLAGDACCNHTCIAGDTIVHASGCGAQLSFVSATGSITRTHALEDPRRVFTDGTRVFALSPAGLAVFDTAGKPLWTIDRDDIATAAVHGDTLYLVAGNELAAFAI